MNRGVELAQTLCARVARMRATLPSLPPCLSSQSAVDNQHARGCDVLHHADGTKHPFSRATHLRQRLLTRRPQHTPARAALAALPLPAVLLCCWEVLSSAQCWHQLQLCV